MNFWGVTWMMTMMMRIASVIVTCPFWGPGFTFYTTDKTVGVKSAPWVLLDSLCVQALAGPSGWEWKR